MQGLSHKSKESELGIINIQTQGAKMNWELSKSMNDQTWREYRESVTITKPDTKFLGRVSHQSPKRGEVYENN